MSTVSGRGPEQRLISRTWRLVAVQTALVFAVALVFLDALAIGVIVYTSHWDAGRRVMQALADPDSLTAPPSGMSVYHLNGREVQHSAGAEETPPDLDAMLATRSGQRIPLHAIHEDGGREYLVGTRQNGAVTVEAALDLSDQEEELHRAYLGLAGAGIAGLGLAALVGAQIARRAIRPLGQALSRQHQFVADASHELRTPLTQLHTRAQLIAREYATGADPERTRQDISQLVRGTRQLGELLEEMLLGAQLRTEPQHFGPVDLAAIAEEAVESERPRARERSLSIGTTIGPGPHTVRGIAPALRRVLNALLDNAVGHTREHGRIEVEVAAAAGGAVVACTVRDNGVGFAPEESQRLFERFARGHRGEGRRFGLGLALVQEVVQAHGGKVTANGRPGEGAEFTITLPAWPTDRRHGPVQPVQPAQPAQPRPAEDRPGQEQADQAPPA